MVLNSGNRKVLKLLKKSIKIAAMEQLDTLIFDAIIKLGDKLEDNKKATKWEQKPHFKRVFIWHCFLIFSLSK